MEKFTKGKNALRAMKIASAAAIAALAILPAFASAATMSGATLTSGTADNLLAYAGTYTFGPVKGFMFDTETLKVWAVLGGILLVIAAVLLVPKLFRGIARRFAGR